MVSIHCWLMYRCRDVECSCSLVDDRVIPIWNTMGVIPGHIKDEVIVVGNHRDGRLSSLPATSSSYSFTLRFQRGCVPCLLTTIDLPGLTIARSWVQPTRPPVPLQRTKSFVAWEPFSV